MEKIGQFSSTSKRRYIVYQIKGSKE